MHRAEQVLNAVASLIEAAADGVHIFTNRTLSLSEDAGELPAVTVNFGEDTPDDEDGAENFSFIDSTLEVETAIYVRGDEEVDVRSALLAQRARIHVALMADQTLSLAFVIGIYYRGADPPEFDSESGHIAARLVCRWAVKYRMNVLDPN